MFFSIIENENENLFKATNSDRPSKAETKQDLNPAVQVLFESEQKPNQTATQKPLSKSHPFYNPSPDEKDSSGILIGNMPEEEKVN